MALDFFFAIIGIMLEENIYKLLKEKGWDLRISNPSYFHTILLSEQKTILDIKAFLAQENTPGNSLNNDKLNSNRNLKIRGKQSWEMILIRCSCIWIKK